MSRIRFLCPECSARLSVETDSVHQFTECPKCRKTIRAWGAPLLDIKFACSQCDKKLIIDVAAAGQQIKCPGCGTINQVPIDDRDNAARAAKRVKPNNAVPLLTSEEVSFLVGEPD